MSNSYYFQNTLHQKVKNLHIKIKRIAIKSINIFTKRNLIENSFAKIKIFFENKEYTKYSTSTKKFIFMKKLLYILSIFYSFYFSNTINKLLTLKNFLLIISFTQRKL